MDSLPTYDDFPWELILSALQGVLTPDEDLRFRQWLSVSPDNQRKYDELQKTWKEKLADYPLYREADEEKAWKAFQQRAGDSSAISVSFEKKAPVMKRWLAVAAAFVLAAGAGWWLLSGKSTFLSYYTAVNEQRKISLPDGSTVILSPQTHFQVGGRYNKSDRTVVLLGGEAHFEVSHQQQLPFTVEMEGVSVRDIGTSFTLQKTEDSTKVTVSAGEVAFIKKETGESREISAGRSLVFYARKNRFGETKEMIQASGNNGSLRFDNAALSDVIAALQKASGKRINLGDSVSGQQRLTVHLDGEPIDNAIKIICASLNLEYAEKNGEYILKNRDSVNHRY